MLVKDIQVQSAVLDLANRAIHLGKRYLMW
jgi:hypothetical protein